MSSDKGRVLIIDDSELIRGLLSDVVASLGYTPIGADGGAAGLEMAAAVDPDAVCLDLWMQDMPGLDVLDRLQHLRPGLPVIIITADPLSDMNAECRARGAYEYIVKPFEVEQVQRALQSAMSHSERTARTSS